MESALRPYSRSPTSEATNPWRRSHRSSGFLSRQILKTVILESECLLRDRSLQVAKPTKVAASTDTFRVVVACFPFASCSFLTSVAGDRADLSTVFFFVRAWSRVDVARHRLIHFSFAMRF